MSDIERAIVKNLDQKQEKKKEESKKNDFSWWHYDDPNTYFCVSTQDKYSFKPG